MPTSICERPAGSAQAFQGNTLLWQPSTNAILHTTAADVMSWRYHPDLRLIAHRRPLGRFAENRVDDDGVWRCTAPHVRPCRLCGEPTALLQICAKCRSWISFMDAREAGDREMAAYWREMFIRAGGWE